MKMWLDRHKVKLGPDFTRYRTVYQKGQLVEIVDPRQTAREREDTQHLKAILEAVGVVSPPAA